MEQQQIKYHELLDNIQQWNLSYRIKEKYANWQLKYSCPNFSESWLALIHHSLVHYLLKSLPAMFTGHKQSTLTLHKQEIQGCYAKILLQRPHLFDLKIVVLVKVSTYYIISHYPQTLADKYLENDIYQLTIQTLLGVPIQMEAYQALVKSLKCQKRQKRASFDNQAEYVNEIRMPTGKSIGRRQGKNQQIFTKTITQVKRYHTQMEQIKKCLKENLYVKSIPRKKPVQYSIQDLKTLHQNPIIANEPKLQQHQRRIDRNLNKKVIQSNQLSQALLANSSLELTDIKIFSIHCSPKKRIDKTHLKPQTTSRGPTVEIKQKKQLPQQYKSTQNSPKKWMGLLQQIREKTYKDRAQLQYKRTIKIQDSTEERIKMLMKKCNSLQKTQQKFFKQSISTLTQLQNGKKDSNARLLTQPCLQHKISFLPKIT